MTFFRVNTDFAINESKSYFLGLKYRVDKILNFLSTFKGEQIEVNYDIQAVLIRLQALNQSKQEESLALSEPKEVAALIKSLEKSLLGALKMRIQQIESFPILSPKEVDQQINEDQLFRLQGTTLNTYVLKNLESFLGLLTDSQEKKKLLEKLALLQEKIQQSKDNASPIFLRAEEDKIPSEAFFPPDQKQAYLPPSSLELKRREIESTSPSAYSIQYKLKKKKIARPPESKKEKKPDCVTSNSPSLMKIGYFVGLLFVGIGAGITVGTVVAFFTELLLPIPIFLGIGFAAGFCLGLKEVYGWGQRFSSGSPCGLFMPKRYQPDTPLPKKREQFL